MRRYMPYALPFLVIGLMASLKLAAQSDDVAKTIKEERVIMDKTVNVDHDMEPLDHYTTEKIRMNGPAWDTVDQKAYKDEYATLLKGRPDGVWEHHPTEITRGNKAQDNMWVSEKGNYSYKWTAQDGPVELTGPYLAFWRQVNGKWLLDCELFIPQMCTGGDFCSHPVRRPPAAPATGEHPGQ